MEVSKLINHDLHCSCGRVHRCDIPQLRIGKGALAFLPEMTAAYKHILLVADKNTYALCGERVKSLLGETVENTCIFTDEGLVVPNKPTTDIAAGYLTERTDFVLGIGSGVINDICKYVSYTHGLNCGIVGTAPSMDGYASSGAAMIFDGMKITFTMHAPKLILGDTEILKDAPMEMIRAGYADIIGKYSALCDWKLSKLVNDEYLCPEVYAIVKESTDEVRGLAAALVARDEAAIGRLMEILVLVGVCLTLLNTTRPGSGSEHHLSHFFEITGLIDSKPYFVHGIDVGYSTVVTAGLRETVRKIKAPVFRSIADEERAAEYKRVYKSEWKSVWDLQAEAKRYEQDAAALYAGKWEDVVAILNECPTAAEITEMLTDVGFVMDDFEAMYGKEKITDGTLWGKDLKDRYSVLWLYDLLDMEASR